MKQALKTKWLNALRSGDYVQGHSYLKQRDVDTDDVTYCCLGVLGEIAGISFTVTEYGIYKTSFGDMALLDGDEEDLVGLSLAKQSQLASRNDGTEPHRKNYWNFERIANWIEKNIKAEKE